ncbi:MAG TPA: hypothetical protein V6C97_08300 [Oculatellaceae cyanobacterium]
MPVTEASDYASSIFTFLFRYANNETSMPYSDSWAPHHLGFYPIGGIKTSQQVCACACVFYECACVSVCARVCVCVCVRMVGRRITWGSILLAG